MEMKFNTSPQPVKSEGKRKAEEFVELYEELLAKQQNNVAKGKKDYMYGYKTHLVNMRMKYGHHGFIFTCNGLPIIPLGGLVSVCGQGQLPTQLLLIMASVMMSGRPFGSLRRKTPPRSILWVDTDKSFFEVQECINKLYKLANIPEGTPSEDVGMHVLSLWECNENETLQYIQEAINDIDPDVIIIDGVSELSFVYYGVTDCKEVTNWLLKNVQGDRNIFMAMHTNEINNKAGGNFGDVLKNKCNDISVVSSNGLRIEVRHTTRNHDKSEFSFIINEEGLPEPPFDFDF